MTTVPRPDISVITPFFNEKAVIAQNVRNLVETLDALPRTWQLIVVDDGSTDGGDDLVRAAAEADPRIELVSYRRNRGRGYALRQGFARSVGTYVVTVESDLNYGTDIIQRLYDRLEETEADIVIASPYCRGGKVENVPFNRAFLSWAGNKVLSAATPAPVTTITGMTRGYRGDRIRCLPLEEDEKEIHLEIVSHATVLGYSFAEIPATLRWKETKKGAPKRKSKFNAGKLIRTHLAFGFNEAPVLLFGSLGSMSLLGGSGIGLYLAYLFFIQGEPIGRRIVLIMTTIFLVLSGLQIFLFYFLSCQNKDLQKELFRIHYHNRELRNVLGNRDAD